MDGNVEIRQSGEIFGVRSAPVMPFGYFGINLLASVLSTDQPVLCFLLDAQRAAETVVEFGPLPMAQEASVGMTV